MGALYLTSNTGAAGKTMVAAGIGRLLANNGKKVGYLKIGADDGDAVFMKAALGLTETPEAMIAGTHDAKKAFESLMAGKDTVIVEGLAGKEKASADIAASLSAKVIFVDAYKDGMSLVDLAAGYKSFGSGLAGVIFNKVPGRQITTVETTVKAGLAKIGINALGFIPEDRMLYSLSVADLAAGLNGRILDDTARAVELVSSFMLGIVGIDRNPTYFSRKTAKAVVLPARRADLALAALATPTSCLVLTGGGEPNDSVREAAKAEQVPIVLVNADTEAVVTNIEKMLAEAKFHQEKKLPHLDEIISQNLEISAL
jgi:uncharacterized protein